MLCPEGRVGSTPTTGTDQRSLDRAPHSARGILAAAHAGTARSMTGPFVGEG